MMKLAIAAAFGLAVPAGAQVAGPTVSGATAPAPLPPVELARLAAARPVIDRIWPVGSYARMLQASLNGLGVAAASAVNTAIANDPAARAELAKSLPDDRRTPAERAADDRSRRDAMRAASDEMQAALVKVEPTLREGLATAYARRFTVAELGELQRFFATPVGRRYAAESLMIMSSPDVMNATVSATTAVFGGLTPAEGNRK